GTMEYIKELEDLIGQKQPIKIVQKGNGTLPGVGTWAHPKLAVFFARWLDVKFSVWCDNTIETILKEGAYVLGEEKVATGELSEDEFIMRAMEIMHSKLDRLKRENESLAKSNKEMSDELNI